MEEGWLLAPAAYRAPEDTYLLLLRHYISLTPQYILLPTHSA
jgi:hypothetical protein